MLIDLVPVIPHDPGGRSKPKWRPESKVTAKFGGDNDCYRYELMELWDSKLPTILWLCMNPSVATIANADPTLMKTGTYARNWGFGSQLIGNIFAYRATDSLRLAAVEDPVGPDNDAALLRMAKQANMVILAYGQPKPLKLRGRGVEVAQMFHKAGVTMRYLRLSNDGTPCHPLYLPGDSMPHVYVPPL